MTEKLTRDEKGVVVRLVEDTLNTKSYESVIAWSKLNIYVKYLRTKRNTVKKNDSVRMPKM